jgi:hypothetical protein
VVRSNDKKRGRLEALRFVLSRLDYPDRDDGLVARVDPLIAGPPETVSADAGESHRHGLPDPEPPAPPTPPLPTPSDDPEVRRPWWRLRGGR